MISPNGGTSALRRGSVVGGVAYSIHQHGLRRTGSAGSSPQPPHHGRRSSQLFSQGDEADEDGNSGGGGGDDEDEGYSTPGSRRKSMLMDRSLNNFRRLMDSAGEFMKDEIEKLPLRKYE